MPKMTFTDRGIKAIRPGADRTDYWKECEQERGIRISIREGQMVAMEKFKPTLYVVLRGP